jgi:zinc transport system permease protein
MLTMPAAISGHFVRDMRKMMLLASGLGAVFMMVGLWLSYFLNLTSGATIILFSGAAYLASLAVQRLIRRPGAFAGSLSG